MNAGSPRSHHANRGGAGSRCDAVGACRRFAGRQEAVRSARRGADAGARAGFAEARIPLRQGRAFQHWWRKVVARSRKCQKARPASRTKKPQTEVRELPVVPPRGSRALGLAEPRGRRFPAGTAPRSSVDRTGLVGGPRDPARRPATTTWRCAAHPVGSPPVRRARPGLVRSRTDPGSRGTARDGIEAGEPAPPASPRAPGARRRRGWYRRASGASGGTEAVQLRPHE